jgi:hypothetical protein
MKIIGPLNLPGHHCLHKSLQFLLTSPPKRGPMSYVLKMEKFNFFIFFLVFSFTAAPPPPPIENTVIATKGRRFNTLSSRRVSSGNGFTWMLVALPLILLVLAGFNMMLFQEKAPFVIATAAGNESMCMVAADGNATRVAAHSVVVGTRTSVPNIKIVNARARARMKDIDADVVPFSKNRACTPTTILPVKIRVLMREHVFLNVDVNTTRVATDIVNTDSINVPSNNIVNARVKDGDSEVVLAADGQHAQKVPFWKIRARTPTILPVKLRVLMRVHVFFNLDGNTTRVVTQIVAAGVSVPSMNIADARRARVKDGDSDVVFGVNAQKVHVPFWKIHVHTPAILLHVRMLIRVFEHVPPSVVVGIVGFLVLCFFGGVLPWWVLYLFGYRVGFGKMHKQCGFPKFHVSLLVSLFGGVGVVQAVFAPADRAALKAAVGTCGWYGDCTGGCLGETADGSCPIFAASNDVTGNPYGVIGAWDVSAVPSMQTSKCTLSLSPSLLATAPSVVVCC